LYFVLGTSTGVRQSKYKVRASSRRNTRRSSPTGLWLDSVAVRDTQRRTRC